METRENFFFPAATNALRGGTGATQRAEVKFHSESQSRNTTHKHMENTRQQMQRNEKTKQNENKIKHPGVSHYSRAKQ